MHSCFAVTETLDSAAIGWVMILDLILDVVVVAAVEKGAWNRTADTFPEWEGSGSCKSHNRVGAILSHLSTHHRTVVWEG